MPKFYHNVDIIFNPIIYKAVTFVTVEAMACGRPVIMYNNSERHIPVDGKTGFIIERDKKQLLNLIDYLQNNRTKLEEMGLQAFQTVQEKHTNEIMISKIEYIYNHLLNTNQPKFKWQTDKDFSLTNFILD
jgi:glycosyltransferase involved in cell wall biosynthesis